MLSKTHGADNYKTALPVEVKLTFVVAIILFYPVAMMCLLQAKPTVKYWFGDTWICTVLIVIAWFVMCEFMLMTKLMAKMMVPIYMVVVPSAVLAIVSQVQSWSMDGIGSELEAQECLAFVGKARLENSWQRAHDLIQECDERITNITGASIAETKRIQAHVYYHDCPAYSDALKTYRKEWEYLQHLEKTYTCGGWCTQSEPLWHSALNPRSRQKKLQDSCSRAVGRDMVSNMLLKGTQVTTYMAVCFFLSLTALLLKPSWLIEL